MMMLGETVRVLKTPVFGSPEETDPAEIALEPELRIPTATPL
jgi:hypothetical protein